MLRIAGGFAQALDDRGRSRQVGIADAEINDIHASRDGFLLHFVDGSEQIRRQRFDTGGILNGETGHAAKLLSSEWRFCVQQCRPIQVSFVQAISRRP